MNKQERKEKTRIGGNRAGFIDQVSEQLKWH
ncbi:hypothetical protein ABIE32_002232 [Comamonas sp. 4034]